MLFSSSVFLFLFLPVTLVGYQLVSRFGRVAMLAWLVLVSLFFYGYWNPVYLILLVVSILANFLFSKKISAGNPEPTRSRWTTIAILANIAVLAYYKYLFSLLNFFHEHRVLPQHFNDVVLPLGISFFTFTQIAYIIDLRQDIAKLQPLVPYSFFVTFFPHLIAGPIIHPRELMPQLEEGRIGGLKRDDVALGLTWFVLGLAKKVLIADRLAPMADALYAHPHSAGLITSWLGSLCYTMQLYFDFSGYSDMALGLARMFSLEFPINFNSPFKASSMIEFWQQWHMTLSRYLNEYVYTPITRSVSRRRLSRGKTLTRKAQATPEGFVNIIATPTVITMFIAGIWHGAGLQYLAWGVLHGVYITVNHAWRVLTPRGSRLHAVVPRPFMVVLTFLCFHISTVLFRAKTLLDACYLLGTLAGFHGKGSAFAAFPYLSELPTFSQFEKHQSSLLAVLIVCFGFVWGLPNTQEILGQTGTNHIAPRNFLPALRWSPTVKWSLGTAVLLCLSILLLDASKSFLYFQF